MMVFYLINKGSFGVVKEAILLCMSCLIVSAIQVQDVSGHIPVEDSLVPSLIISLMKCKHF